MITNYSQTLDEIFNILCMYLPIDRNQRLQFISYFIQMSRTSKEMHDTFDLNMATGQRVLTIEVYEFIPPIIEINPDFDFDLTLLKAAFKRYFEAQEKARGVMAKYQQEQLNREHSANPMDMFQSSNSPKPFRQIDLKDKVPELNINYDEFKISPNIPNIGRASL